MRDSKRVDFKVTKGGSLTGNMRVPGDKSISHRALMLGAVANGVTHISGFLGSEDTEATMNVLQSMGVEIVQTDDKVIVIEGVGLKGLTAPGEPLNLGNSGTSVRLFAGLLSGQNFDSQLYGDESLMQRPMRRIVQPLQQMGADIHCSGEGLLPIRISGNNKLHGINYLMPVASAQLKSAIMLAGLYASGKTCVTEPAVTRDHSERMLSYFGCALEKNDGRICLSPSPLHAQEVSIPGDISSAAFFMVAAAILPGSNLLLEEVGFNPSRHAVVQILQSMGANITIEDEKVLCGEPVANIRVCFSELHGITIPPHLVPIAIDEIPILMIAAACAKGETSLSHAGELRMKESDRLKAMYEGLKSIGIDVLEQEDGMRVRGGMMGGGTVDSYGDHRIAMAFSIAGLAALATIKIRDCSNVNTSFPGFVNCFSPLGLADSIREECDG